MEKLLKRRRRRRHLPRTATGRVLLIMASRPGIVAEEDLRRLAQWEYEQILQRPLATERTR